MRTKLSIVIAAVLLSSSVSVYAQSYSNFTWAKAPQAENTSPSTGSPQAQYKIVNGVKVLCAPPVKTPPPPVKNPPAPPAPPSPPTSTSGSSSNSGSTSTSGSSSTSGSTSTSGSNATGGAGGNSTSSSNANGGAGGQGGSGGQGGNGVGTGGNSTSNAAGGTATGGSSSSTSKGGSATGGQGGSSSANSGSSNANGTNTSTNSLNGGNTNSSNTLNGGSNTSSNKSANSVQGGAQSLTGGATTVGGQNASTQSGSENNIDASTHNNYKSVIIPSVVPETPAANVGIGNVIESTTTCGPVQTVIKTPIEGVFFGVVSHTKVVQGYTYDLASVFGTDGKQVVYRYVTDATGTVHVMGSQAVIFSTVVGISGSRNIALGGGGSSGSWGQAGAGTSSSMTQLVTNIQIHDCEIGTLNPPSDAPTVRETPVAHIHE